MAVEKPASNTRRIVFSGLIGNTMEWYDFSVYGYFAAIIAPQFFPSSSPAVSLIAAFGAFAAGFLVRPLGGLVFGRIGDLVGRRRALFLSVLAMAVPTVLIGCLPTYEHIGILAPILIVALRIVQGLSVGGEYTSSLIFLAEHAPPQRRARTAMWGMWGATAGILLGSGVGALVAQLLEEEQLFSWGWRIPFLLGAVVAVTGILVRRAIHTQPTTSGSDNPVRDAFTTHLGAVVKVALLNVANGVGFYAVFVYAVTYIKNVDGLDESMGLNLNTLSMAALLLILPVTAALSDRFGRKPLVILGAASLAFGAIPLFHLLHHSDPAMILMGELGFVLGLGLLAGGLAAANVEMMPAPIRCTGLAFAYNASIGWFGGTTPLIAAWLIVETADPIAPGYWVAAAGGVSLLAALVLMRETRFSEL
ncbi:MAG: MFS transporter [Gammaproteobacteria bacterium]|jgi:MHS family proline/betaine transporter-like MFS transporter